MTVRPGIALAAVLALVVCAVPARAQDASSLKKDMIGQWELSTTERSKTCVITLKGAGHALFPQISPVVRDELIAFFVKTLKP